MRFSPLFILLFLALAAYGQQTSVAVLPSDGDEKAFNNDDIETLTNRMRSVALKTLPSETFALLTQEVVVKRLGGAENFIKECRESSCIVDLGKKAMVDYVAQASLGKIRNKMRIKVEIYDVSTSKLVGIYDGDGEYFDDYFALLKAVDQNVPNVFKKIPGVVPVQAKAVQSIGDVSGGSLVDSRDGKRYKIVKIGNQTWMAENLNYNASGSKCYDNQESNCQKYGRLYNWSTAKTACPRGWHLPSDADWNVLMKFVNPSCSDNNDCAGAGTKLKAASGWNSNGNGTDAYGFSALPGGYGSSGGYFSHVGSYGYWWSSSEYGSNYAYSRYMGYNGESAFYYNDGKSILYSVRCLQD